MEPTYEISFEVVKGGFVSLVVTRREEERVDSWGGCLEKGADLNAPLPCMWEGDEKITLVYLDDKTKAAILAKWAELEA